METKPDIQGWGSDLDPAKRPGVPMHLEPTPRPGAHSKEPTAQEPDVEVLRRPELEGLTPVFGTATPPRLVSGMVKRWAYHYPDHLTRRWMLLLLSDRIDAWEGRVERVVLPTAALGVTLGALVMMRRLSWTS